MHRLVSAVDTIRSEARTGRVRAFDLPTRIFHWSLLSLIVCAWASYELAGPLNDPTLRWHRWNGYAILTLVVWRVLWGFAGSTTARFVNFVPSPETVVRYARAVGRGLKPHYLGHNPLGTLMILALLAVVGTQTVLGLYTLEHNEITAGPLKRTIGDEATEVVSWLHRRGFNLILGLAVVHVAANIATTWWLRDPVIPAMLTGQKPAEAYVDARETRGGSLPAALVCLAAALAIVFGGIWALGGRVL